MSDQGKKLSYPSALRNRAPILEILREVLPQSGIVLEIASGSGEHVIHFATELEGLIWQPSDPSIEARASIAAWSQENPRSNLLPPLDIDTTRENWAANHADAIVAINMIHISPYSATEGLLKGAGKLLPNQGVLFLYGPYRQRGRPFVQSNVEFDSSLKARNPEWGIRQLEDVVQAAERHGLFLDKVVEMPANNLSVIFRRR